MTLLPGVTLHLVHAATPLGERLAGRLRANDPAEAQIARAALGGQRKAAPAVAGVLEEIALALAADRPTLILPGFGGAALDAAAALDVPLPDHLRALAKPDAAHAPLHAVKGRFQDADRAFAAAAANLTRAAELAALTGARLTALARTP